MEAIMSELPLAIFTSCALLGAGGFAALGIEQMLPRPLAGENPAGEPASSEKADKRPVVFLCIVLAGFVHLAAPINAVFALLGVGRSPLSNEIAMGMAFTVAAALFCLLKLTGKLKGAADRAYSLALAVLGLLFAAFTGAAYLMGTIATWDTPLTIVESVGLSLFAGAVLSAALKALLGVGPFSKTERTALSAVAAVGFVVGFGALGLHVTQTGSLHSSMIQGSALAQSAMAPLIVSALAGLASLLACLRTRAGEKAKKAPSIAALVLVAASVFAARLVFYGIQLSVGL